MSDPTFLDVALSAAAAGLSVVPPRMDGSKAPLGSWKSYQHFPPEEAQLRRWYADPALTGMGVITGRVSGNLELFEFDDRPTYEAYKSAAAAAGLGPLVDRIEAGYLEVSPKPGVHWLYRCAEIAGNNKLACRPKTPEESKHPKDREQVLIETRGEGGYVVTAPSNGKTHPSGSCYSLLSGGFDSIATITPEERRDLFALARAFHVAPATVQEAAERGAVKNHRPLAGQGQGRPGDDFNQKAVWAELLEAQGWTFAYRQGDCDYWRRPGKTHGVSACTGWGGKDYFYCFSTSTEFEEGKPLDKVGFHAQTVYGGDFKATVKALAEAGYGRAIEAAGKQGRPARPVVNDEAGWRLELMRRADSDQLLKNHYNAVMIVENAYPGLVGYNEFRQRIEARIPSPWRKEPGQWTDADTGELAFHLAKEFTSFTLDALSAAVMTVAYRHPFNPAQERLRALAEQWDGEARLDSWLIDYLGAAHNSSNERYLQEIGSAWMKGVAARVLFPGCKRDDVLVTRGEQGIGKSTVALAIAEAIHPDSFTDSLGNLESKDSKAAIRGIIIAELGELSVLNKTDLESIKVYVATRTDHFREAYGRGERDYPRTVSFIGTTNHPTFLKDPTGNRRFWPVTLPAPINIKRFTEALPQLLGEAARRVLNGEPWFVSDQVALAQANEVRAAHYQDDVWTESALNAAHRLLSPGCTLDGANGEFVTVAAIMGAMGIRIEQQTVPNQMRIGGILRVAGWHDKRKRIGDWKEGRMVVAWYPPNPVHPETLFTHPVHPPTARQTADVHPVTPCSPSFEDLVKMEDMEDHGSHGSSDSQNCSESSAPANLPFYRNRGSQGEQGEQSGKQRANPVHPLCSPTQQGEQSPVPPLLPAEPRPLICTWRPHDGGLITKCSDPDLQRDEAGQVVCCANCGSASARLAGGGV